MDDNDKLVSRLLDEVDGRFVDGVNMTKRCHDNFVMGLTHVT